MSEGTAEAVSGPVTAAVGTAVALAAEYGIVATEPVVLHDRANILVHLAPAPLVARIAWVTALARPDVRDYLARDLAIGEYLDKVGVPVVAPSRDLPAGPHERDGRLITFWRHARPAQDQTHRPAEFSGLLADLHAALRGFPGDLPTEPSLMVTEIVKHLREPPEVLDGLVADERRVLAALAAEGRPVQALHGDAHPGNLLRTVDGPRWIDFEDTWRGPVDWDLACVAFSPRMDGTAALAAYPGAPTVADLGASATARRLQGVIWSLLMARRDPSRVEGARQLLADWRAERSW
ncbi:MAG TPA: phosphotransferase [Pseudonocardiaceae bacterium]|jgi:hypothetical protein|nr:phosphotransferase [Pseudonocardiaceae bacterium]